MSWLGFGCRTITSSVKSFNAIFDITFQYVVCCFNQFIPNASLLLILEIWCHVDGVPEDWGFDISEECSVVFVKATILVWSFKLTLLLPTTIRGFYRLLTVRRVACYFFNIVCSPFIILNKSAINALWLRCITWLLPFWNVLISFRYASIRPFTLNHVCSSRLNLCCLIGCQVSILVGVFLCFYNVH